MARFIITLKGKGIRKAGVTKLVEKLKSEYGEEVSVSVQNKELPKSRAEEFAEAQGHLSDAKSIGEDLRDQLQEVLDGMPENLQQGTKAEERQAAIDALEEFVQHCEDAEGVDVSFPGMY